MYELQVRQLWQPVSKLVVEVLLSVVELCVVNNFVRLLFVSTSINFSRKTICNNDYVVWDN